MLSWLTGGSKEKKDELQKNEKREPRKPRSDKPLKVEYKFLNTEKTQQLLKNKPRQLSSSSESESEDDLEDTSEQQKNSQIEGVVNNCMKECEHINNNLNKPGILGKSIYYSYKQKLFKIFNTLDTIEVSKFPTLRTSIREAIKIAKRTEILLESVNCTTGTTVVTANAVNVVPEPMDLDDEDLNEQQDDTREISLTEILMQDSELKLLALNATKGQETLPKHGNSLTGETNLLSGLAMGQECNSVNGGLEENFVQSSSPLSEPVQLLIPNGNDQFTLNDGPLRQILYREDVRHRKIVPVCAVGRFRRGKSFLLDHMRKYLEFQGAPDWLKKGSSSEQGFKWRGGSVRETSGILMWHEPFLVGDDIAVLLFDTQGTFDGETSIRVNSFIFALSTMLSSVQIYNVSEFIQMDDFTNLQTFLEYGRLVMTECDEKAFQTLAILVRDWKFPQEKSYGFAGGEAHLTDWMKKSEGSATREVTEMLNACFDNIWCYLLPYPGDKVSRDQDFKGDHADIDPDFLNHLSAFIEKTLGKRSLIPKRNGRNDMIAQDFLQYVRMCVTELQKTELQAHSILQEAAAVDHIKHVTSSIDFYKQEMRNQMPETEDIISLHHSCQEKALNMYDSVRKFGGKNVTEKYREVLRKEIEDIYNEEVKRFIEDRKLKRQEVVEEKIRDAKRLHKRKIKAFLSKGSFEMTLLDYHNTLRVETCKFFLRETKSETSETHIAECITKLDKRLKEVYENNVDEYNQKRAEMKSKKRDEDCKNAVTSALEKYHQIMKTECKDDKICESIESAHQLAKEKAMESTDKLYSTYKARHLVEKYIAQLDNDIEKEFENYRSENEDKIRQKEHEEQLELDALAASAEKYYKEKLNSHGDHIFEDYDRLKKAHKYALDCLKREVYQPITIKLGSAKCKHCITSSKQNIKSLYTNYKSTCHNKNNYKMLVESYRNDIQNTVSGNQNISNDAFLEQHKRIKANICKSYEENCSEKSNSDEIINGLALELDSIFDGVFQQKKTSEAADKIRQEEEISDKIFNFFNSKVVLLAVGRDYLPNLGNQLNDLLNETLVELGKLWHGSDESLNSKWEELKKVLQTEISKLMQKNKDIEPRKSESEIAFEEGTKKYNTEMNELMSKQPDIEVLMRYHKTFAVKAALRVFKSTFRTTQCTKDLEEDFMKNLETCYEKFEITSAINQRTKRLEKTPKNQKSYAIGIDLGTTYSCASVYKDGKLELIKNKEKQHTTPSVVYIDDKEIIVGEAAQHKGFEDTENCISEVKRIIGREYKDSVVQELKKLFGFKVIKEKNMPVIKTTKNEKKTWKIEEISAEVLKELKRHAEVQLNSPVHDAVVTIPAYFTEPQRSATMQACKLAGLNILRLLNEPTAAAITYGVENMSDLSRNVLVFDFGGGTCDISILEVKSGNFTVKASKGDNKLGGEDFDDRIMEYVIGKIESQNDKKFDSSSRRRLRFKCEIAKRRLTDSPEYTLSLVECFEGEDMDFSIKRKEFEECCKDLFERALKPVEECLKEANMKKNQINEIVLAGGSSRMPKIRQMLSTYFDGKTLNSSVNPDEAISQGAAIEAARLTGECKTDIKVLDITPFSLGVSLADNTVNPQIRKNSQIPCKVTMPYVTASDYQTSLEICVYQGEVFSDKDKNTLLGKFTLGNIRRAKAGETKANVTFEINNNGILEVKAVEMNTLGGENTSSITITKNVCA